MKIIFFQRGLGAKKGREMWKKRQKMAFFTILAYYVQLKPCIAPNNS